ncbi:class I SAM-dependent methyltransferase [Methylobacterium komagatae]|uniref:Class I SAM-dependent methyltransferase n=1 Tax=Methylobacterium komagatae TaxID=374425 RepID=A0ABW2BEE6_9HYPH
MLRLSLLLSFAFLAPAQAAGPLSSPGAPAEAFPKPDRPVAEIVAPQWTAEAERDRIGEFEAVAKAMKIGPGETVADIGAGSGYYVVRLSPRVGPSGKVLAEDVTPAYLASLERRVKGLGNVTVVRGEPHDPRLPPASVDAVVLVHMYHEITQPFGLLYNLAPAMRPGGRVGILDANDIPSRHGTPPALLRCELAAVGYRETGFHTMPDGTYLAVFEAPAPEARPKPDTIRPCKDAASAR